ncbi:MAG: creatininase family protein, partial [Deltaproteobacteria bacterium]
MPKTKVKKNMPDAGRDPLDILGIIRRLEVGPVRLDRNRVTAPYMVSQNGKTDTIELVYRFEENVFVPGDGHSMNLASMLSAQVALNYGLFCDEIIFHGPFDRDDQRFIKEMAANTAREIFVKKFLEPNPFFLKQVTGLPPIRRESYLRARLLFPDEQGTARAKVRSHCCGAARWHMDPSKHAVLSSGGKDSLLSFGVLKEMGREVHPVFVNESGRHWFTALNAYRHFTDHVPTTARVWTNADRVFNWMLRHLPFVRQDFKRVRSDEYPIRLWTVAVFVFGALPLLKKRGIGRLIIGDEFDTTHRLSFSGITHYDGLYDQSRYFDNVLSRYFHKKGWGISQFSLLRPLSEILIEKILIERYPELQGHQVSCHASHKKEKHVLPCGDCE